MPRSGSGDTFVGAVMTMAAKRGLCAKSACLIKRLPRRRVPGFTAVGRPPANDGALRAQLPALVAFLAGRAPSGGMGTC
jgi:hypothetical protein